MDSQEYLITKSGDYIRVVKERRKNSFFQKPKEPNLTCPRYKI